MATTSTAQRLNGFDLEALQTTVTTLRRQPLAGKATFRGRTVWDRGPAVDGCTEQMEQAGQVSERRFTFRGDHPPALLGFDTGPTAGEVLLAALGACMSATYASHATARGIRLDELEVEVEGDLDLNGFLQLAPTRAGFAGIRARLRVRSDADDAALEELRQLSAKASPVYDSVANPVAITSTVERKGNAT